MTAARQAVSVDADRLKEIQARANAATKGPWSVDEWNLAVETPDGRALVLLDDRETPAPALADADFVANARTDIPYLLALVQGMRERETQITEALEVLTGNDYLWRTGQITAKTAMDGNRECLAVLASGPDTDSST